VAAGVGGTSQAHSDLGVGVSDAAGCVSDGEHYLAGDLAVFQEADRVLSLSQREGPVEGRRYIAGVDERGKVLQFGGADQAEEYGEPLADEG
jgi:hypothetical protein